VFVGEVSRCDLHCAFLVNHRTNLYGTVVQYRPVLYSCTVRPAMYSCKVQVCAAQYRPVMCSCTVPICTVQLYTKTDNVQLYSTDLYGTAVH